MTRIAVLAATAASGPWPRPSTTTTSVLSRVQSMCQASPHIVSPVIGMHITPASASPFTGSRDDRTRAIMTVPWLVETMSNAPGANRRIAPRPFPGVPAVENPSSLARARSAMPGPRSMASTSTPALPPVPTFRTTITPSVACRARLVAASVTMSSSRPNSSLDRPARSPAPRAARLASPIWLASVTGMAVFTGPPASSPSGVIGRSISGSAPAAPPALMLCPPRPGDARAFPLFGPDVEFVDEPLGPAQAKSHAARRGVPVRKRKADVGNTRAVVLERQPQPGAESVLESLDTESPPPAVGQRIPGQFARGRDDLRLIDEPESRGDGPYTDRVTRVDDVLLVADLNDLIRRHCHPRPRWPVAPAPAGRGPWTCRRSEGSCPCRYPVRCGRPGA